MRSFSTRRGAFEMNYLLVVILSLAGIALMLAIVPGVVDAAEGAKNAQCQNLGQALAEISSGAVEVC